MTTAFTTKQSEQVNGQMSIWHRCSAIFGIAGVKF